MKNAKTDTDTDWEENWTFAQTTKSREQTQKKLQTTYKQFKRPWSSRKRVNFLILRSWVRFSLLAVQEKHFSSLLLNFKKNHEKIKKQNLYSNEAFRIELIAVSSKTNQSNKTSRLSRKPAKWGVKNANTETDVHKKKQLSWIFQRLEGKLDFCANNQIKGTDTKKAWNILQTIRTTMEQSEARKSFNLKVVSSSLTVCSSRKTFFFAFFWTLIIKKNHEKI